MLMLDASARLLLLDPPATVQKGGVGSDGPVQLRDTGEARPAAQSPPSDPRSLLLLLLLLVVVVIIVVVFVVVVVAGEPLPVAYAGEAHGGRNATVGARAFAVMMVVVVVAVAVFVDAVEALGGDGGDVAAFEDAGGSTHAVALSDSARAGCRSRRRLLGAVGSHGERECVGATAHVGFAEGPVHRFTRAPGHAELGGNGVPEFGLESAGNISWVVHTGAGRVGLVFPMVEFGEERRIIPIVDSRELVALLLVPVSSLLEVVLVVQSAADGAAAWDFKADVVPFHASATEYNDFGIFGWRPLASGLIRGD